MVPNVGKSGTSFKGALSYFLHDKRLEGERARWTSERVAWTETRGLMTDDPAQAMQIMIATAKDAERLKRESGVASTGRKSAKSVYAYSLAWHPDEAGQIDRAEMIRAVDASLAAIGAQGHQAVIICHQDEPHPHVHIVVNRVHPETGKLFVPSNDHRKLDAWAYAYREARGEHLKYCPKRAEKAAAREHEPDPDKRRAHVQKRFADQTAKAKREPSQGDILAALSADQKAQHKQQWKDLAARYRENREAVWNERPNFKAIAAQHKQDTRADWVEFGREQAAERRAFNADEKTLLGALSNAVAAAQAQGWQWGMKGYLTAVFTRFAFDGAERRRVFTDYQAHNKSMFSARMYAGLQAKTAAAKRDHAARLGRIKTEYDTARALLKDKQDQERAKIRSAWQTYYATRAQEQPRRGRTWPRRSSAARQENPAMQWEFEKAKRLPVANISPRGPSVSAPAPQPAPMGAPPAPVPRQAAPSVDRAAEFAKTQQGKEIVARQAPKAAPDSLRSKVPDAMRPRAAATPAPTTPARDIWNKSAAPEEQPRARDVWNEKAKDPLERTRRRGRDRDFDRER